MAKKVLKQLLLVTLVLCILMLGTTTVLAEEQTEQTQQTEQEHSDAEKFVCLLGDPSRNETFTKQVSMLEHPATVITSLESLVEKEDTESPCWVFVYNVSHDDYPADIPENLNYQGIFFVDSIVTPDANSWEEVLETWTEYLVSFSQKGIPIYFFASNNPDFEMYGARVIGKTKEYLEMLSENELSNIARSEDEDEGNTIVYSVKLEEDIVGHIYFRVVNGSDIDASSRAFFMLRELVNAY